MESAVNGKKSPAGRRQFTLGRSFMCALALVIEMGLFFLS